MEGGRKQAAEGRQREEGRKDTADVPCMVFCLLGAAPIRAVLCCAVLALSILSYPTLLLLVALPLHGTCSGGRRLTACACACRLPPRLAALTFPSSPPPPRRHRGKPQTPPETLVPVCPSVCEWY